MSSPCPPVITVIPVGTNPEDGTGIPDRDAWDIVNQNFAALLACVQTLGGGTPTDLTPITRFTNRYLDWRVAFAGLADQDPATVNSTLVGYGRGGLLFGNTVIMQGTTGSQLPVYKFGNDRRFAAWFNGTGTNVCFVFRPGGFSTTNPFGIPFYGPTYPTHGTLGAAFIEPQFQYSFSIQAWCRKVNAVDSSSCRMSFGFANNTVVTPSKPIPRVGLMGDGAGGYLYGSVNCPDGGVGINGDSDRDANSFQPTDLVNPGTNEWHTRIKLIPATPTAGGQIVCYHNFTKVAQFATSVNLPRGHQGTSDQYDRLEASILNLSGDTIGLHVPELMISELQFVMEDDFSI